MELAIMTGLLIAALWAGATRPETKQVQKQVANCLWEG